MNFIFFGDKHERPDVPENRTDDYHRSVNAKTEEIKQLAIKYKAKALLQPGDFLHKPKFSDQFLGEVVKRWSTVDVYKMKGDMMTGKLSVSEAAEQLNNWTPILGAVGNHELYGESLKSYPKTSLAFLENIGFMHFPTKENPYIFTGEDGLTVAVTATSYDIGMDSPNRLDDYIIEEKAADIHIHIVHGYLTNRDMGDMFPHTVLDKITKKTQADLTISGHDHIGFPLTEVDGKYFVNPGSPVRMKNDKKEMKRRPKVLLIEATKEKGLKIKTIYLKSAEQGEDVLSREKVEERNVRNAQMEEIKSIVTKAQVTSGSNITEIIKEIADNKNLDEDVKTEAIDAVSEKMDSIQKTTTKPTPYTIEKVVLENFKSHVHSEFELSAGLNVFIGESGAGKSALMSAFDWVYENSGRNPRRLIHHGKDYAKVTLYLSNGYIISRVVEKKKSGKNGYEIYNPALAQLEEHNTKSLELVQELLGFTKLDIDTDKDIPLNFQRQGDGWFFIGGGFTPSMRAKIIGAVYQTHYVDAVLKDLEADTKKLNVIEREKKTKLKETESKIESYEYVKAEKKKLSLIESKMAEIERLTAKKEILQSQYDELCHIEAQIKIKEHTVAELYQIEVAMDKMNDLMTKRIMRNRLSEQVSRLDRMMAEAAIAKNSLSNLEQVEQARDKMDALDKAIETRNELRGKLNDYQVKQAEYSDLERRIQHFDKTLKELSFIEEAEDKVKQLSVLVSNRLRLAERLHEMQRIQQEGKIAAHASREANEHLTNVAEEYKTLLKELGSCPVCRNKIDATRIDDILTSAV